MKIRKKYSPGFVIHKNSSQIFYEIRWDLVGCNLNCHFCWNPMTNRDSIDNESWDKSVDFVYNETFKKCNSNSQKKIIRFTGGEPTLHWKQLSEVFDLFKESKVTNNIPILIQTNGVEMGRNNINLNNLYDIKQDIIFEFSFKGTNESEFELLTQKDGNLYREQLHGYNTLINISKINHHIKVIPVLGIYHSSVKSKISRYIFVNPKSQEILFDNLNNWNKEFKMIWVNSKDKWVEPVRMSPKPVWDSTYKRCAEGAKIIKYIPEGIATNVLGVFPIKPKSNKFVEKIINGIYRNPIA